ncbi:ribosomal protein S18 acetylase RimI-like enzyme [Micromonospora violae]|uniref:Ribosomal protein S18 acetylase RimI-like enzyme n=1 Tax=Micromonospora violae TaxID=1278207 RepID=A0A4Q7UBY0_9ACTN|nr:GNAT family N-acetyltransferase [Micromonospora violae]RZT78154.1 ribosomal protein S18 acetylase RimI-like enzyme [Micromonospora violae]
MIPPRIRRRRATDLDGCVAALAEVHRVDRYPLNWPADPHRWLREPHPARAWVAVDADADAGIVGHIAVHRIPNQVGGPPGRPTAEVARLFVAPRARGLALGGALLGRARKWANERGVDLVLEVAAGGVAAAALYERTGWRCIGTSTAPWAAPDGSAVSLRHYTLRHRAPGSDGTPASTARRRASRPAASRSSGGSSTSTS